MRNPLLWLTLLAAFALCLSARAQEKQQDPAPPAPKPDTQAKPDDKQQSEDEKGDEKPEQKQEEEKEPTGLEKLLKELHSDSSATRELALRGLVQMGEKAVPELNKILGVGLFKDAPKMSDELKARIEKLIKDLDAEEWKVREAATEELEKIGEPAETHLRRVAKFGTPEVQARAERLLVKIAEKKRGGKTEEEIRQLNFNAKLLAARALGEMNTSKSRNTGLLAALADKDRMISTAALMFLRKDTGWSFGFGPEDLDTAAETVVKKWTEYLEKPTKPEDEEAVSLAAKLATGDTLKTHATWNLESVYTTRSMRTTFEGRGTERKQVTKMSTYTVYSRLAQEQQLVDSIQEAAGELLKFEREFSVHKSGQQSYSQREGNIFGQPGQMRMDSTDLAGCKLEYTGQPGTCDVKALQGNMTLTRRQWLSQNYARLELLLPGNPVKPGDSWEVPELPAYKLLHSLSPQWANVLQVASVKLSCKLLEVAEKDGKKIARIAVTAQLGAKEDAGTAIRAGAMNVAVRISSFGTGNLRTLANSWLIGDCTFDFDSGTVTSFKLFGSLFQPESENAGMAARQNYEQTSHGYFNLEATANREEKK